MTRTSFRRFLAVSLVACLMAVPALAQKITGDIAGTVTDPTGAVVSGATVTAENPATGFKLSTTTSATGDYRLVNLAPGTYKMTAAASGFKAVVRDAVVAVATVTRSNFQMVVGAEGESIIVESSTPLVETTENRLGTLIEARRVEDLPNSGRDFNNLLDAIPGVQRTPGGGFQSLNINGQRASSTNFAVDGIPNNDRYYGESALNQAAIAGTAATLVPLEAITEFAVQSNPSAEYGVRGGSVVNVALKSGTNELHGGLFWIRHTDFADAQNPFAPSGFRLNQLGVHGGFPLKRDKTFVYTSFQAFRLKSVFSSQVDLPTPEEIADATGCVTTGINPDTAGTGVACLNVGPGPGSDQILGNADDGTVNSIGAALLSFIPTDPLGDGNARVSTNNSLDVDGFHIKFDHLFNDRHRISAKYIYGDSFNSQPGAAGVPQSVGPMATGPDMWNSVAPSRAQLAGVNYTWTISPTKILESRIGWTRFSQRIGVNNNINPEDLGLNTGPLGSGPEDTENLGVPAVYYLGYFGQSDYSIIGGIQGYPIVTRPNSTYDWQEHFTWVKGSHTLKLGGQYQNAYSKTRRDRGRPGLYFGTYGIYYCAYYAVCDPGFLGVYGFTDAQQDVASLNQLLLGLLTGSGRSFGVSPRRIFQHSAGFYIQDSWKVKPNFTLELGLRWDIVGALGEANNLGDNFLPGDPLADPATGFVSLADQSLYEKDANNLGPRVGFAWDIFGSGKTVLRGGYTLNYDVPNFGTIHAPQTFLSLFSGARAGAFTQIPQGNFPVSIVATPPDNLDPILGGNGVIANPFTNPLCVAFVCVAPDVNIFGPGLTPPGPFNIVQVIRDFQTPMNHAVNLTLEQELNSKVAFSIAYVGTFGRELANWRDLNACPMSVADCDDSRRPFGTQFPGLYDHVAQLNNDGFSNYNALQTSFKLRNFHGLTAQVNFVWSRALDTGSVNRGITFFSFSQNPYDPAFSYAPSDFDVPLNFNYSLLYDAPTIPNLPKWLGEGWQINSVLRAHQGRPFTPFVRTDTSNQGLRRTAASYDGRPIQYDYDNRDAFVAQSFTAPGEFDPCGRGGAGLPLSPFFTPCPGTVGSTRNFLRQPGLSQLDFGIFKNTKVGERLTVRFSWEVFNLLNHTNFAFSTGNINDSGYGTYFATPDVGLGFSPVLGSGAKRNMQFGLRVSF